MNTRISISYLLALSVATISACGGGTTSPNEGQPLISINQPPTISGNMPVSIVEGQNYNFTPTASDPDNDTLTFSISNKPDWAAFNTTTGNLSGTPNAQDVGTNSKILITVSDSAASASLASFDITVERLPEDNVPPTIAN